MDVEGKGYDNVKSEDIFRNKEVNEDDIKN